MSLSDADRLALHELCHALIDGTASEKQHLELARRLAESEEARRVYVRTMALSASLFDYAGEMQMEEPAGVAAHEVPARGWLWGAGSALAAAAALCVGLWWGGAGHSSVREAELASAALPDAEDVVARLSGVKDCRWTGSGPAAGEELHRGQQMRLLSGTAEIAFDSGAVVTLEGPASLDLTSEWEAILRHGTLKAKVPHEAIGFRISNPEVEVVDLGTEFSMVAEESGGTEVFVTKGAVETRGARGVQAPVVLRERQARRFARAGSGEVKDREQKMRRLARLAAPPSAAEPLGFLHWSFDEEAGGTVSAQAAGLAGKGSPLAAIAGSWPRAVGRYGRAVSLDGTTSARTSLAAFPNGPRAAACWVRLPSETALSEGSTILAWSKAGEGMPRVELGWNQQPAQGPVGAVRVEVGHGALVGTTPLRDGRWHHLVFGLSPARKPGKLQARLYVDGRLESISTRRGGLHREKRPAAREASLLIGQALDGEEAGFHGELDELYVATRAFTPQEIKGLIERNQPAGELLVAEE